MLQQLMNQVFGADVVGADAGLGSAILFNGSIVIAKIKFVSFTLALICGVLLVVVLKRSRLGQAIRATAQDARAARIMGVDTDKVYAATFSLNAAICGIAGALVVMTWVIDHPEGQPSYRWQPTRPDTSPSAAQNVRYPLHRLT